MANLDNIVAGLRARGLKVVETPGWITRGYAGQDLQAIRGVLWHHTATGRGAYAGSNAPTLNMCINGRSDLAGPLCNIVFGRDGTVHLVATGVANHAGAGSAPGIPTDMGNHYLIGIEMESSGVAPWDWTPEQLYWAPRLGAALEQMYLLGLPPEQRLQLAHYEYSSQGKIDPAGWPGGMDGLRASINAILAGASAPAPVVPASIPKPAPKPAVASGATTVQRSDNEIHWIVERGDSLSKISQYYYGDTSHVQALANYNGIKNVNALSVGQKVWIPGPMVWTVEAPDTYESIAAYYGVDADWLARKNGDANRHSTIYIGNTVVVL